MLAPFLLDWIGKDAFSRFEEAERLELVSLAAELDPDLATMWFSDKIQMTLVARIGGLVGTPEVIAWNRLAAEGLAASATGEAVDKLREIRKKGDEAFRDHVSRLVVKARRQKGQG